MVMTIVGLVATNIDRATDNEVDNVRHVSAPATPPSSDNGEQMTYLSMTTSRL